MRRTAQWTEQQLEKAGLKQWTVQWKARKWRWAAALLQSENSKWSAKATLWQPELHSSALRGRRQARPKKRWEQDFVDYIRNILPEADSTWQDLAKDRQWWLAETEKFANW